jgi:SsrA-binding protein
MCIVDDAMAENDRHLVENRRARHDYFIEETVEAGIALRGTEVKSLRAGQGSLREAYARIDRGEAWLLGMHIPPYAQGNRWNHDPLRPRKLLLHRREIEGLLLTVRQKGYTLVPLRLYLKGGRVKVELGLARGKHSYDKRESIAARDAARAIDRAVKERLQR